MAEHEECDAIWHRDDGSCAWGEVTIRYRAGNQARVFRYRDRTGGAAAVALLPQNRLVLVEQYRDALGRSSLEIPRGSRLSGEASEETAVRELAEETGLLGVPRGILGYVLPDDGLLDSRVPLVLMDASGEPRPQAEEGISRVVVLPLAEAAALVADGTIEDGFTQAALLRLLLPGVCLCPAAGYTPREMTVAGPEPDRGW